ncbi:ribonuclease H-like domain-containing protein [Tanacetum coccineum]
MVEKPVWNNASGMNHQNSQRLTHPHPKGNFVPKAVLMKSGHKTLNTARQNFSKAAVPVNTVRRNVTTVGSKAVASDNKGNEANVVKASACWVWRPNQKVLDHVSRYNGASMNFKRFDYGNPQLKLQEKGVIDSGCSRHMTRNKSYLSDYKEIDGGFVAFGRDPKGGKITGKSKISIDIECVVLSPDFKLLDENHVLFRVPRKDNMYSIDLKNVVPQGGLTCFFAKATPDESNLWHMRLGHVNFKTINKLVKGNLVRGIENLIDLKMKVIRCVNRTEFKNKVMNQFYEMKGIKREFNVARTPQQNRVAERKNRTLIEAVKTMLADSKLPTTFWAEAVNTACYVQNRVLVIKPHNKTPYELFLGKKHALSFMRPFECLVTILNTVDHLGKFDGKADEGFFVGYSTNSKAFKLFDIDALTKSMNYKPVVAGNQSNGIAGTKACENAGKARVETVPGKDYILLPFLTQDPPFSSSSKDSPDAGFKPSGEEEKKDVEHLENEDSEVPNTEEPRVNQEQDESVNSTNNINTVSSTVNTASIEDNVVDENIVYGCVDDPNMPNLEEIVYSDDDEDVDAEADMTNLDTHILVSPTPTTRIYKDHLLEQIVGDIHLAPQTRKMTKIEPKKVIQALTDLSWIEAMQDELLQFKLQKVWTLVDLPYGKRAIGTKWIYRNRKDERGIVVRNKARLVAQGYTQEEGIDYDEVFSPVVRIEAIRLFLAYASFKDFVVYQMDVKSAFMYGKIEEEVYVCQPPGFKDPEFPGRVYKVEKALYGLHQAPKAWYETLSTYLLDNGFQRGTIDKTFFIKKVKGELTFFLGLQVTQKDDGIFISQDKYVDEILKKFGFSTVKTASTPMETSKPLLKDAEAEDVYVHLYRSMIGSLMYLTSSRPDIMFVVCACARFQVTPKVSHLHVVKGIFRYLKGQPKLGLWYHKDSPFHLKAYTDSDYVGASLDRKCTTGVANPTTEAEYAATSSCYGQVLWIQNQLLDYGYNFINTKIFIDNESTICIVKNPVFHSKTKHIEIRHHFIRDSRKKRLIQVIKIHTDHNVADLLIKAFKIDDWNGLEMLRMKLKLKLAKINAARLLTTARLPLELQLLRAFLVYKRNTSLIDETVYEERGDNMERAATSTASLDTKQDNGNIIRTQSMATHNEPIPQRTGLGSGPKRQDTILGDRPAQTRFERLSKQSNDPPLSGVNTPGSGEDILKIMELMEICTKLSCLGECQDYLGFGDYYAPITTAGVSISTAEPSTPPPTTTVIKDEDLIIAQTLMKMRSAKSKEKAKERGSK